MTTPASPTDRVRSVVFANRGEPVTSLFIAARCGMTRGWATSILAKLVADGTLEVRNAEGGTYEWTTTT